MVISRSAIAAARSSADKQFTYVRVPRAHMLMKHTQVSREGVVTEPVSCTSFHCDEKLTGSLLLSSLMVLCLVVGRRWWPTRAIRQRRSASRP